MPRRGDVLLCRDCGQTCPKPYPGPVTNGDWVFVDDRPFPYALCGGCHLAQTRRILGRRSA